MSRAGAAAWSDRPAVAPAPDALFDTVGWADVLATLGARARFATASPALPPLFAFSRGPVTVGFLGFPVAATEPEAFPAAMPERIDLLRWSRSCLDGDSPPRAGTRAVPLPETVIPDLAAWPVRGARRIRKDLAFAGRQGTVLRDARPDDAAALHRIYLETLARHRGGQRYTLAYFAALLALAARGGALRVRVAEVPGEDGVAGFCVVARDRGRGWYLHGGVGARWRATGASDLLLYDAICAARDAGCHAFSLMPSPPAQPGLVRFKQKWGEVDGTWTTFDRPLTLRGRMLDGLLRARRRREPGR